MYQCTEKKKCINEENIRKQRGIISLTNVSYCSYSSLHLSISKQEEDITETQKKSTNIFIKEIDWCN